MSSEKKSLFLAKMVERTLLSGEKADKKTYHVTLDLRGADFTYEVGDSLAVQPMNHPDLVEKTVHFLAAKGSERVLDRQGNEATLWEHLSSKSTITEVSRKLITFFAERQSNLEKKERLEFLLQEGNKEQLKLYQGEREIWDLLEEHREVSIEPQTFVSMLQPLLPRFYSIASSRHVVGDFVDLTVAELCYESRGHIRRGVCTDYLCHRAPLHESVIPVYIQKHKGFTLPENHEVPLIMIGPGTGVAPYRGFMQERVFHGARGAHWLFFGERYRATQFLYESYWKQLVQEGRLRLETAFSRDQEHKVYVQHKMLEHGEELFRWIEGGAHLYVCGDAHKMAKDVDAAMHEIVRLYGQKNEAATKEYIKRLRSEKRYLRDVY